MKLHKIDIVAACFVVVLGIYLVVQAPAPIDDDPGNKGEKIHVNRLLELVANENNVVRTMWTKSIVVDGKKVGFGFGEEWKKDGVDEGPLPALFLRQTASLLEKSPVPLSLFLGSDFPINTANKFTGYQAVHFDKIRESGHNQFFYDEDVSRYTAMFPDEVVVGACASCHNEHPDTSKTNWEMNDIMGATTWAYPKEYVTRDELIFVINELRSAFSMAYARYLEKTKTFKNKPAVGQQWPKEGYYLPSRKAFMSRLEQLAAQNTLGMVLEIKQSIIADIVQSSP